jgi:putative DNA primase/helicase
MNFESFAEQHGLIIDHIVHDRWTRVPTSDKPHSKNGAYIWDGHSGAVQNWAMHEKPISFKSQEVIRLSAEEMRQRQEKKRLELERKKHKQESAAKRAAHFMKSAKKKLHPYLISKGFSNHNGERGYVLNDMLLVPMSIDYHLVGCQMIMPDGSKKFMSGQITKGAELIMDAGGYDILCEGYATAMSIRRALKKSDCRYRIHVCFSASNILQISAKNPNCIIVADHDTIGIKTAIATGKPYWLSPIEGEDFNDFELRVGPIEAGKSLIEAGLKVMTG